jgi:putative ABC transport system permease protein
MNWLAELGRRLAHLARWRQFDRELDEEMRFHLEMRARECGPEAARRRLGNLTLWREDSREAWGWTWAETWIADLRHALRGLRRNSGFTCAAVLTLALGIGAGTAVFSVVHAVLLRSLPFYQPERLMLAWQTREQYGQDRVVVSYVNFRAWAEQNRSFERLAAFANNSARMDLGDELVSIPGTIVSGEFFSTLGVPPLLGRTFTPTDERPVAPSLVVLSHSFWQRLGGRADLVGKPLRLDRDLVTVVGVMPRGFNFPSDTELWFPLSSNDERNLNGGHYLRVIGRLKPGIPPARALLELQTVAAGLRLAHPAENRGIGATVVSLADEIVGKVRRALWILMGAVLCVLLIACTNVANLLAVRAASRRREFALRLALGAGRWRVARCLLTESLLLALAGAALGMVAAAALLRAFVALDPVHLPRIQEVALNGPVLLVSVLTALATGLLAGLAPALGAGLKATAGRGLLAAAQIALTVVLLVGGGLLARSFVARVNVPLGFRPEGTLGVELPWWTHSHIDELETRLAALPGVRSVGAATAFPQNPAGTTCTDCLVLEGQPAPSGAASNTGKMVATPGYFQAAGIALLRGRFFSAQDGAETAKVALINAALARRDFAGRDPLGRRVRLDNGDWLTVVGVLENVKGFGVSGDPLPTIYFPHSQGSWNNGVQLLLRTSVPPASLAATVRREIRAWNRRTLIEKLDTLDNLMASEVAVPRFYMLLLAGFGLLALAVSAVGLYGTVNYSVARRRHELGVRVALGATRADVLQLILGQGLSWAAAGLALGLVGAWASTRVLKSLLFGVRPTDAATYVTASAVIAAAVLVACCLPARRATQVDPLETLRHE